MSFQQVLLDQGWKSRLRSCVPKIPTERQLTNFKTQPLRENQRASQIKKKREEPEGGGWLAHWASLLPEAAQGSVSLPPWETLLFLWCR